MTIETSIQATIQIPAHQRYGIRNGQVYVPADGAKNRLVVLDVKTFEGCDDIVVFDELHGSERRIDAFKLAMARYTVLVTGHTDVGTN